MKTNVKRMALGLIMVTGLLFSVQAQTNSPGADKKAAFAEKKAPLTPEEKATKRTAKLTELLSLTDEQQKAVYAVELESAKKEAEFREQYKAQQQVNKEKMQKFRSERQAAYKKILTEEQITKLKESKPQKPAGKSKYPSRQRFHEGAPKSE